MEKHLILSLIIIIIGTLFCSQKVTYATNNKINITYEAHVQNVGWQKTINESETAGTTGIALRMEAINIHNSNPDFKLLYRVHVQNIGWMDWKEQGEIAGTTGIALRMEAIQIKLENQKEEKYSVQYRSHVQNIGWQDWVYDGETSGTTGIALRAEAIEIRIVEKNDTQKPNENHITDNTGSSLKQGIDVSKYQGTIDWGKVKQARN